MTHIYRWTKTRYGPLTDRLQGRVGEHCRVITRGRNGNVWIAFADGFQAVVPMYAVRRGK